MAQVSKQQIVPIDLGVRRYDITVGSGLMDSVIENVISLVALRRIFIITDHHVGALYLKTLQTQCDAQNLEMIVIQMDAGEQSKSFSTVESILNQIFEHKPERSDVLLALGGGVVGDITGFVASILLRGVPFIQVPTTLLSQVDSSVGGKTGVNHASGKNLIGSFYQPKAVIADIDVLLSLPDRQYWAGYAEIIKYGAVYDAEFFEWLESHADDIKAKKMDVMQSMVSRSCHIKAQVVSHDETEQGTRAILNFGHTFGHALEKVAGYDGTLLHGEAVAIGMILAARLSVEMKALSNDIVQRLEQHITSVGLPTSVYDIAPQWDKEAIIDALFQDKKVKDGALVFILLENLGQCVISHDVPVESVRCVLDNMLETVK